MVAVRSAIHLSPLFRFPEPPLIAMVSRHFTGVALELRPAAAFSPATPRRRLRLRDLWDRTLGWRQAALQTVGLTLILQAFIIASPYYMQLALDSVVPSLDVGLLTLLALGFGAFTVLNSGAALLREFVMLSTGASLGYGLANNLGRRLSRLPISWFERRHVGDVLSRFSSVQPIQEALTHGLVASIVDGTLASVTLAIMFLYNSRLASIAMATIGLYALLRAASFPIERTTREDAIIAVAKEQSTLIETVRGITTVRIFGKENERHVLWQNRLTDATNAAIRVSRVTIWQQTLNGLLFGLEGVVSIWLGIRLVLAGGFSIGMLVAYLAYKQLGTPNNPGAIWPEMIQYA